MANWTFKLFLGLVGYSLSKVEAKKYDGILPKYTILCPMYDETEVVGNLVAALSRLDYPTNKLEIFLLLEEDDKKTQEFIRKNLDLPGHFKVVVVPAGGPKTKPNACNYGLGLATGEFLVIYDAEDRPEPDQLKKAVYEFYSSGPDLGAVQCKLAYFNEKKNLLTRMFSMEYAVWFSYYLPALHDLGLAVPLGGTSNHFRRSLLRRLGGWDPLNVTEDAELGLRLYDMGYYVSVIDSTTWEEACSKVVPWIKQRTRWTKGYIQTSVKYLLNPSRLSVRQKVGAWLFIMGTPVFNLLYIPVNALYFLHVPEYFEGVTGILALMNMIYGITSLSIIHGISRKSFFCLLMPFYWGLHGAAAFRAVYQYFFDRHRWEKTPHGIS